MHIVVVTNGLTALANCHLELSRQLRDAGHRVTFVCARRRAQRFVDNGEEVVALDHDDRFAGLAEADGRPLLSSPVGIVRWVGRRRRLRRESITSSEMVDTVESLAPDVLVIDVEMHSAIVATANLGVPRVLAMSQFSIFRAPGLPPLSSGLGPATGPVGAARIQLAWARVRIGSMIFRFRNRLGLAGLAALVEPVMLDTVSPVDIGALAQHHGVSLQETTDRTQWLRPFVARDLPILCYNSLDMELPHRPPDRIHYVGPLIRLDRNEPPLPPAERERWNTLVAAKARAADGSGRPLVYCSLGTLWSAGGGLLRRIIGVFEARSDWDLVIGLGGVLTPDDLGPLPANVLPLPWAPQLEILAEADAAITHGGTASIREAVLFGVPSVLYSIDVLDQDGNSRRAVHHDLGVLGGLEDPPEAIEATIEKALTDPRIAAGVAGMRDLFEKAIAAPTAVGLIERFGQRKQP